jgi:hypothetical protein
MREPGTKPDRRSSGPSPALATSRARTAVRQRQLAHQRVVRQLERREQDEMLTLQQAKKAQSHGSVQGDALDRVLFLQGVDLFPNARGPFGLLRSRLSGICCSLRSHTSMAVSRRSGCTDAHFCASAFPALTAQDPAISRPPASSTTSHGDSPPTSLRRASFSSRCGSPS